MAGHVKKYLQLHQEAQVLLELMEKRAAQLTFTAICPTEPCGVTDGTQAPVMAQEESSTH